jgi:hypothetical protein
MVVIGALVLGPATFIAVHAAESDERAKTDPEDPDFLVQGEYLGDLAKPEGKQKLGVQVIALGDGKFRAVGYFGGLPGDGWDGSEVRVSEGQIQNDVVLFKDGEYTATLQGGSLNIAAEGGVLVAELDKILRQSPTQDAKAPDGAIVLFDGQNADEFVDGRLTDDGLLMNGATGKRKLGSGKLHLEFKLPFEPRGRGQARGNSGCYLQGRYEVQILDSFGLKGEKNECGAIYEVSAPRVNMTYPPLSWQTYDIDFTDATYEDGKKTENARLTVRHNGVLIQENVEVPGPTRAAPFSESAEDGTLYLQDHGHPVRYRNIWFVPAEKE